MKIVIAGAGEVGFHIAKLLSKEAQDIIIIDTDKDKLNKIESLLDVMIVRGDATSFQLMEDVKISETDIFIAVTQLQNTNLMASFIAKRSGAKKVIARITNPELLERKNQINFQRAGIDMLISPEELAANEIANLIEESVFNDMHSFGNNALNLFGIILGRKAKFINRTVKDIADTFGEKLNFTPIFIIRPHSNGFASIVPNEETFYREGDHVYFIALKTAREYIIDYLGKKDEVLSDVMILGGGRIGKKTAQILGEYNHNLKIIERDSSRAEDLADQLDDVLVVNGDGRDSDLLDEEGISEVDAFVALTGRSETNIMACLLAKSKGVKKTIALVENTEYLHLGQDIGIDGFINKKLMAANSLFKHVRRGKVLDVMNIFDLPAEVLEYRVKEDSRIANKMIKNIHLPKEVVIGGVIRKNEGYIPKKDFEILPHDRIVIFSRSETIKEVEQLFL